ncbi:MAG: hypothetical protein ACHQQ3_12160 [Gemmatimonadales bacterium]
MRRMRSFRNKVLALAAFALAGLTPAEGSAQQPAGSWQDSWFWGAYGGQTSFATAIARTNAPTIGIDWMLTRTRYALNVFADQAYFNAVSTIPDFSTPAARRVNITDMRRVGFAWTIFTPAVQMVKPYFNVGWAFNFIKTAAPQPPASFASVQARDSVLARIDDARSQGKFFGSFGVMPMYGKFAPFAQYTIMPTKGTGDWMLNGEGFTKIWSIGLRYNFGTSIEKKW